MGPIKQGLSGRFLEIVSLGDIYKVRTQVGGGGNHDESIWVRTGREGRGFKPGEYVRISTVYSPFLKIKKVQNGQSLGFLLRTYFMDGPPSFF